VSEHRFLTVAELIALDPPSAGTKSPDNPLAAADLIVAHFLHNGSENIVYGKERLEKILESGTAAPLLTIKVRVRDDGDDLAVLCAMVEALRGHHDYEGATTH
jgi:hypothetical protein